MLSTDQVTMKFGKMINAKICGYQKENCNLEITVYYSYTFILKTN